MRIDGNASAGGPRSGNGITGPKEPFTFSTEPRDILSRLEAAHARVSPLGAIDTSVKASTQSTKRPRGGQVRFDRVEIAALYRRGNTTQQIAELLGCQVKTVRAALRQQGVTRRGERS